LRGQGVEGGQRQTGKSMLKHLLIRQLVKDDPDDTVRLYGGCRLGVMKRKLPGHVRGAASVPSEAKDQEEAKDSGEEKHPARDGNNALEARAEGRTPESGEESGEPKVREENGASEAVPGLQKAKELGVLEKKPGQS
jgi:hypothetical protein